MVEIESLWRALSSPFRAGAVRLDKTKFACLPLKLGGMPLGHESRTKAQETGQAEAQADSGAWNIVKRYHGNPSLTKT